MTSTMTGTIVVAVAAIVLFALVKLAMHERVAHGQTIRGPDGIEGLGEIERNGDRIDVFDRDRSVTFVAAKPGLQRFSGHGSGS